MTDENPVNDEPITEDSFYLDLNGEGETLTKEVHEVKSRKTAGTFTFNYKVTSVEV